MTWQDSCHIIPSELIVVNLFWCPCIFYALFSHGKKSAYGMEESANQQLDYPYGCWMFYTNQLNVALQQQ